MKFKVTYIYKQNKATAFCAIQYWLPRIGEKIVINGYTLLITDIIYSLSEGESSCVNVTIEVEV